MAESAPAGTRSPVDAQGCVTADSPCIQCGYNLRTVHRDARCPECGTSVGRSLQGDLLRYSDSQWLATLASGLLIIVLTGVIGPLSLFGAQIVLLAVLEAGPDGAFDPRSPTPLVVHGALFALTLIVSAVGLWLFTTAEPGGLDTRTEGRLRGLIRGAICVAVASVLGLFLSAGRAGAAGALLVVCLASLTCCAGGTLLRLRRLARRIPSPADGDAAITLLVVHAIGMAFVLLGFLSELVTGGPVVSTEATWLTASGGCVSIVAGFLALLLLNRVRRLLAQAAKEAAEISGKKVS